MKDHDESQGYSIPVSLAIAIMFMLGGGLTWLIVGVLLKNWIIIGFGIQVFQILEGISQAICLGGAAFTGCTTVVSVARSLPLKKERAALLEQERQEQQLLTDYANDSESPELTRKRLIKLSAESPELEDLVSDCLAQMDKMDRLQAKQEALISANDARYLADTVGVLDTVERRLCHNFRNVINICIAEDDPGDFDKKKVKKYLKDNDKKLSDTAELLRASADWINQYNEDNTGDRSEVENWVAVIRDSLSREEDLNE